MKGQTKSVKAKANVNHNPNKPGPVNDSPEGPYGPLMGEPDHGGMKGDETVSGKNGMTFHMK